MKNYYLTIVGLFGAIGVGLGAFGAHFLKEKMKLGLITMDQYTGFDTATKYQLMHTIVMLTLFFINKDKNEKWINISIKLFILGITLFSGSLYLLTTRTLTGMEFLTFLGPVTPLGGVALIGGWICLVIQAFKFGVKKD